MELGRISRGPEEFEFGLKDVQTGCKEWFYEKVSEEEAMKGKETLAVISSVFTVWPGVNNDRNYFLVVKPAVQ